MGYTADVTVVIPTFNRADLICQSLDSILSQKVKPSYLFVVDDGSTDDTRQVLKPYMDRIEYRFQDNAGKSRALNAVLPFVKTEFVWFFDDDDVAFPCALDLLLAAFDGHPEYGFTYGSFDLLDSGSGDQLALATIPVATASDCDANMRRLYLFRDCTVMMTGALLRTEAVRTVGGFNDELLRSQDYDLMVRVGATYDFGYCGSAIYAWRQHNGVRGPGDALHRVKDRMAIWAKFTEPTGLHLRQVVPLQIFIGATVAHTLSEAELREALIRRAWATAPKLALEYPVRDLLHALNLDRDARLTTQQIDFLQGLFDDAFVAYRRKWPLLSLLRLLVTESGNEALLHLSISLLRLGRRQPRAKLAIPLLLWGFFGKQFAQLGRVLRLTVS